MDNIFTSVEFYISIFAVLLSAISLLYTYHKNRDSLEVVFYKPVTHTFDAKYKKSDDQLHKAARNDVFFTQIRVINSSNHDIGYSELFIEIEGLKTRAIYPSNEEDIIVIESSDKDHNGNLVINKDTPVESGILKARTNNILRLTVANMEDKLDLNSHFRIKVTIKINKSKFSNIFRSRKRKISNTVEVSHTFTSDEINYQIPVPELEQHIHKFI